MGILYLTATLLPIITNMLGTDSEVVITSSELADMLDLSTKAVGTWLRNVGAKEVRHAKARRWLVDRALVDRLTSSEDTADSHSENKTARLGRYPDGP